MQSQAKQHIDMIADSLVNNHAVVMIGAGFSKNAVKNNDAENIKSFASWNDLAKICLKKIDPNYDETKPYFGNPLSVFQEFENTFGRDALENLFIEHIPDDDYLPSNLHIRLLELPWKDVFSTNYDTLLERTCAHVTSRRYNIVLSEKDLPYSAETARIIKLHGTLNSNTKLIITEEDYRTYSSEHALFVNTIRQALVENTLCLIGFSASDPNFLNWIGWIKDNLGLDNAKKIYFITGKPPVVGKVKMLEEKNIETIALSDGNAGETMQVVLAKFFDALHNKINSKDEENDTWIGLKKFFEKSELSAEELIELLKDIHTSYPGWVIAPKKNRDTLSYVIYLVRNKIFSKKIDESISLQLFYEYDWLHKKAAMPLLPYEAQKLEVTLKENKAKANTKEYKNMELSLLRFYRESNWNDKWKELSTEIKKEELSREQANEYMYELCMYAMFQFDHVELKSLLLSWKISKNDLQWCLKQSYILAEIGELDKSEFIAKEALETARQQLIKKTPNDKCYLQSLESCLVSLINYIRHAQLTFGTEEKVNYEKVLKRDNGNGFFWKFDTENESYEMLLSESYMPKKVVSKRPGFDIGIEINTTSFGSDNGEVNTAFSFLRFREETGHPFRIRNVVSNKGVKGTVKRIKQRNSYWAMLTLIMAEDDKLIDDVYNRSSLASINNSEADSICDNYIKILNRVFNCIEPQKIYEQNNIYEFCAYVLPEAISRLVTKCSINKIDEVINLFLKICTSNKIESFRNISDILKRIVNSMREEDLLKHLDLFLNYPLYLNELIERITNYLYPIRWYANEAFKIKREDDGFVSKKIDGLLSLCNSKDTYEKAINAVVILYFMVKFSAEHKSALKQALWNNCDKFSLPIIPGFLKTVILDLPSDDIITVIGNLNAFIEDSLNGYATQKNTYKDIGWILYEADKMIEKTDIGQDKCRAFLILLIRILRKELDGYLSHKSSPAYFDINTFAKQVYMVIELIAKVILKNSIILDKNSAEYKDLITIFDIMTKNQMQSILLKYLLQGKVDLSIWKNSLMSNDELSSYDAVESYYILIKYNKIEITNTIQLFTFALLMCPRNKVSWLLSLWRYIVENRADVLDEKVLNDLLNKLDFLKEETRYTIDEDEAIISEKLLVKSKATRLAYCLYEYYNDRKIEVPQTLREWQANCNSPEEFNDIKALWGN